MPVQFLNPMGHNERSFKINFDPYEQTVGKQHRPNKYPGHVLQGSTKTRAIYVHSSYKEMMSREEINET